ncbi:MAG: DUF177 domain-containing protein [Algoriphagus sp.]|uniref:YceD family protein n=1 Tax=Algoriphagus sp. TaxID=1872435 RepID=UPI0017C83C12|nr:DUF177 domain-containing protein [Algoriphagus sp.]NVJ85381.1 DUF177 domain-containing protein [Algoriphagus sp.]
MKFLKHFDIEVIKYREGAHELDFQVDDRFFKEFEDNDFVNKGNLTVRVNLDKGVNVIEMDFHIQGTVRLICDRSLEEFDYPLEIEEFILFKYGSEEKEIDENIFMITRDTPSINVAQLIYEFILLAIPAKKIHPDFRNELDEEESESEGQYVYFDSKSDQEVESRDDEPENIDPRWEKLKKLK